MATIDGIEIQHPCSASWAAMDGDARARFCKLCSKVVHDTTALSTCELEKLLAAPAPPCLRVHRDRAGRVLTRDRLAALAFVGLAACTGGASAGGVRADAEAVATPIAEVEAVAPPIAEGVAEPAVPTMGEPVMMGQAAVEPPPIAPMMGKPAWRPAPPPEAPSATPDRPAPKMGKVALPRE